LSDDVNFVRAEDEQFGTVLCPKDERVLSRLEKGETIEVRSVLK
jgi:hypothetical protein